MNPQTSTLLLLPGLDGHGPFFDKLRAALPDAVSTRTLSYPLTLASYDALAEWVIAELGPLTKEPLFLLGESFGGPLALRLAGDPRLTVKGLILTATFVRPPMPVPILKFLARHYAWLVRQRFAATVIDFFLCNRTDRTIAERVLAHLRAHPVETIPGRVHAIAGVAMAKELSRLPCPVLILKATKDRIVLTDYPKASMGKAELKRLATPHMLLESASRDAAEMISHFIKGAESPIA